MATPGESNVVYFGNLRGVVSEDAIRSFAAKAGSISAVTMADSKRFAYVAYATDAAADKAVATLHNQEVEGRKITVEKSKTPTPPEERKPRRERAPATTESGEPRGEHKTHIVVRNLPRDFDSEALGKVFSSCGEVVKSRITRGLGRVHFADEAGATAALDMAGTEVEGRTIGVERELLRQRRRGAGGSGSGRKAASGGAAGTSVSDSAPPAGGREPRAPRRIRVDGLAEGTTADNLKAHFASSGRIEAAKVIEGRGHGFVTFEDDSTATKALGLDGSSLNGAKLAVTIDAGRKRRERGAGRRRTADDEEEGAPEASEEEAAAAPESTVWIGGLKRDVHTSELLTKALAKYGRVQSVELARNGAFAYIKMDSDAAVEAAVAGLNGAELEGTAVTVEAATGPKPRRNRGPRRSPSGGSPSGGDRRRRGPRRNRGPRRSGSDE